MKKTMNYTPGPWKANARLIASAPEMVDILEHCYNWGIGFEKSSGVKPEWLQDVENILNKIKGE